MPPSSAPRERLRSAGTVTVIQLDCRSTICTQKIYLPANRTGYDHSETTVGKLSARRIQIFRVPFFVIIFFDLLFLNK